MKVKDLIAALHGFDGEMDVVVRIPYDVDLGEGWSGTEYSDFDIKDVDQSIFDISNWINPSNKQVIVIYI